MSVQPSTTVQDLAEAFARLDSGEGWAFAVLIACSVERNAGTGGHGQNQYQTASVARAALATGCGKVSCNRFAEMAGTSTTRVARYLAAWNWAAELGLCTPSADLCPADAATAPWPADAMWNEIFTASNAALKAAGQGAAEDSVAVLKAQHDAEEAAAKAEQAAQAAASAAALKAAEEKYAAAVKAAERQHALTLEAAELSERQAVAKAEAMAAQKVAVAETNARLKAEAIAKEEARRKHRAAEDAKSLAVIQAAAAERAKVVAAQKAEAAARVKAEAEARKAADADREAAATAVLASFNEAVTEALSWLAMAADTGLKVSASQELELAAAIAALTPRGQLVHS